VNRVKTTDERCCVWVLKPSRKKATQLSIPACPGRAVDVMLCVRAAKMIVIQQHWETWRGSCGYFGFHVVEVSPSQRRPYTFCQKEKRANN